VARRRQRSRRKQAETPKSTHQRQGDEGRRMRETWCRERGLSWRGCGASSPSPHHETTPSGRACPQSRNQARTGRWNRCRAPLLRDNSLELRSRTGSAGNVRGLNVDAVTATLALTVVSPAAAMLLSITEQVSGARQGALVQGQACATFAFDQLWHGQWACACFNQKLWME